MKGPLQSGYGLVIENADCSNAPAFESPEFTLHIVDMIGHEKRDHVQSILDDAVRQERTLVASTPITPDTGQHEKDPLQWLVDNALWVGLGVGALLIVPSLLRR